jgi:hypothetical protein
MALTDTEIKKAKAKEKACPNYAAFAGCHILELLFDSRVGDHEPCGLRRAVPLP